VILVTLALVLPLALGALRLEFTTNYRAFFRADEPRLADLTRFQAAYGKDDSVLFVLIPRDGDVFSAPALAAIHDLTEGAWLIPHARRVDSLTNFPYSRAEGDELAVGDLVPDPSALDAAGRAAVRSTALADPRLVGRLVSARGDAAGVYVTIELPGVAPRHEVPAVAQAARALAAQVRGAHPDLDIHLTGISIMDEALATIPMADVMRLMPLVFAVIFVAMTWLLRQWRLVAATFAVMLLAIGAAMGLAGWYGVLLTPPSAVAPIIVLTLAVADATHIVVSFQDARREGREAVAALAQSLRLNLSPVTLTSLTTALGFLGLNLSASPPFQHLGNLVALGVLFAYVLALIFLPALLLVLPLQDPRRASAAGGAAMVRLADWVILRRRALLWGSVLGTLGLLAGVPRNELNDAFVEYFNERVPFRQATEVATARLTGLYLLEVDLRSGEAGGIAAPAYLESLDGFAAWLREQPEVMHVAALSDTLRHVTRNLNGDDRAAYRLPATREEAAQSLLLYEMALPFGRDLTDQLSLDKSATRVTAALRPLSSNALLDLERRVRAWLAGRPGIGGFTATGAPLVFAYVGSENIRGILLGTTITLIAISVLLIYVLRSLRLGLVSLLPNLVPTAMAFGVWGLVVGQVGMAIASVTCMTLGVIVNDSIHFLWKYRAKRQDGADPAGAVRYAFATVGTALWVTSLVLVLGFCVLLFSSFVPNAGMGLLTAITIAFALAADLLFLPPLLMLVDRDRP
jgi:predicted RND superfamily exporter protein